MNPAPYEHPNEYAETHFMIVNVGNDEKVLSVVMDREKKLLGSGYEKIIALRDMYSKKYRDRAGNTINDTITMDFVAGFQKTIEKMSEPDKIKMCFAIMELEAWFLGMYNIFEQLDHTLTVDYIEKKLGFNLSVIDPQTIFFKPSDKVDDILKLVGKRYKKSRDDAESICSKMKMNDFSNAFENERCISFKEFYAVILNLKAGN
jgi:hypothetical protein